MEEIICKKAVTKGLLVGEVQRGMEEGTDSGLEFTETDHLLIQCGTVIPLLQKVFDFKDHIILTLNYIVLKDA